MRGIDKIILGTVQFGLKYGINNHTGKPSSSAVFDILMEAFKRNIKCLDTAVAYGNAHHLIGEFHRTNPTFSFEVISKLPHDVTLKPDFSANQYLDELNIHSLKALLFHSYESYQKNRTQLKCLIDKHGFIAGVTQWGVSVYTNQQFADVIEDEFIQIIQLPFNLLDNYSLRGDLMKTAKYKGKILHTRSAFLQGLFFVEDDNRTVRPLSEELNQLRMIARKLEMSIGDLALNYCLQQSLIDNVLIGVETREQLVKNLSCLKYKIPESYIDEINSIRIADVDLINPAKWQKKLF